MILVSGCLVQFRIARKSTLYHRDSKLIGLHDAYVCSGYLAALALPRVQYEAAVNPAARRYQDGLEVNDSGEETLFVILHRRKGLPQTETSVQNTTVPPKLGVKRKLVVFRTRSKL